MLKKDDTCSVGTTEGELASHTLEICMVDILEEFSVMY
jgi:hypothetical protein